MYQTLGQTFVGWPWRDHQTDHPFPNRIRVKAWLCPEGIKWPLAVTYLRKCQVYSLYAFSSVVQLFLHQCTVLNDVNEHQVYIFNLQDRRGGGKCLSLWGCTVQIALRASGACKHFKATLLLLSVVESLTFSLFAE